ncbi:MAG TPA: 4-hydroxy-tetrahydrodipicolinate reductase [Thermoanaerobaculia bacterium]|jgi:4-hydroxy-tetrahydrodipicolinate reductase|nr:4-hydroxy-tetrahydrodipicolinate reductase [Thermoanaerobaculia bacterium]
MLKITLAGATGWIGKPLVDAIEAADDLQLVAAAARSAAGRQLGDLTIVGTVEEALQTPSDVFVDYTSATAVKRNVLLAIDAGRHVVIGSSGLSDLDFGEIDAAAQAKGVGVLAVGNFAVSAILLQQFAAMAARQMPSWEIIDYAHDSKPDAPSGTARELAWRLSQVASPQTRIPVADTQGRPDARGAEVSGSQIHSVRLPGHTIGLEVIFGREDERLSIRYEGGTGAAPYIAGTLVAIRRVAGVKGLQRGME